MRKLHLSFIGLLLGLAGMIFVAGGNAAAQGGGVDALLPDSMKGATFVGTETCASCHEKQNDEFKLSTHARIAVEGETEGVAQGCETCHGPGSVHAENGGGKDNILNPRQKPEVCFTCHLEKKAEFRLPYRHPVLEGKMSCADCHNLHGPEARPWTATSMEGVNEACFKCHKDQRGPFPWEHEALRDGCTTCHKVHGSITDKMLVARDANLCLRCHIQTDFPFVGDRNHYGTNFNMTQGTCWSAGCHTAVHGSYYERFLRE
jgi:predicted CXXCH cytochrome family protein